VECFRSRWAPGGHAQPVENSRALVEVRGQEVGARLEKRLPLPGVHVPGVLHDDIPPGPMVPGRIRKFAIEYREAGASS